MGGWSRVLPIRFPWDQPSVLCDPRRPADPKGPEVKIVSCHLGNEVTPLDGLMMDTRWGSIDPGIRVLLMRQHGLDGDQIDDLMNKSSRLLGISGLSGDMRDCLGWNAPRE